MYHAHAAHEEYKHEPVSSMLPIKNILRKSKRHLGSSTGVPPAAAPEPAPAHQGRYANGGTQQLGSIKAGPPGRSITVTQPFSFSHPRNMAMGAPAYSQMKPSAPRSPSRYASS